MVIRSWGVVLVLSLPLRHATIAHQNKRCQGSDTVSLALVFGRVDNKWLLWDVVVRSDAVFDTAGTLVAAGPLGQDVDGSSLQHGDVLLAVIPHKAAEFVHKLAKVEGCALSLCAVREMNVLPLLVDDVVSVALHANGQSAVLHSQFTEGIDTARLEKFTNNAVGLGEKRAVHEEHTSSLVGQRLRHHWASNAASH